MGDIKAHLREDYGFSRDILDDLHIYLEILTNKRPPNSDIKIFRSTKTILAGYKNLYYDRR